MAGAANEDVVDADPDEVESDVQVVRLDVRVAEDDSSSGPWVDATTHKTPKVKAAVQVANVVRRATGGTRMEGGAKWNHSESMAAFSTPLMP